jgi:hypothetical protein
MPRDSSGNYSLPSLGNPAVTGTPITIAWWNGTSTDMASAFTDSLSRSGLGGMLVPFTLVDGSVGTPAFAFQNEPNTGLYRAGAGDTRLAVQGADAFQWTTTQLTAFHGFLGPPPNGNGLTATGAGNGHGVQATGGGTGNGVQAQGGTSTSAGVAGVAGTGSGYGIYGSGAGGGLGGYFLSSAANVDVVRAGGYISLQSATNPTSTTGFTNRITPKNVAKVWGLIRTDGVGGVSVLDGFNIASVSLGLTSMTVTFATALGSNLYSAPGTAHASQALAYNPTTKATGTLVIQVATLAAPGTPLNPTTTAFDVDLAIYGVQ